MGRENALFSHIDWYSVDRNQRQQMATDIESVDANRSLNTSIEDLVAYFAEKYSIEVPVLDVDGLVVDQREQQIDVSQDHNRWITDRSKPFYITGTEIGVEIPFSGEAEVFRIRPNTFSFNSPVASVQKSKLTFSITGIGLDATQVRAQIERSVAEIQSNLANLRPGVKVMNAELPNQARNAIEFRRNKLLGDRSMVASLGFKMKERPSSPKTFVAPEVRRKLTPTLPPASTAPYKPEPAIAPSDYEHILGVMQGMTQVMELSPSAFHQVDEEALRSHFLVQLNGHYQGQATGETFNYEGKTDILIRSEGRNIFIAECKFWSGPKKLVETIDQLLSYSSWRDTKTAIVVFNRNRDFSKVLGAIPEAVRSHPQYKKDLPDSGETSFRYLFANRDDRNRELYLTVLVFNVPTLR